jgi:CheY-like chemotaxis protein
MMTVAQRKSRASVTRQVETTMVRVPDEESDGVRKTDADRQRALAVKRLRIVLAEDDAIVAALLAELLTDMNHDVCAIVTTERATVQAAAKHAPDMVIADARLGAGSGIRAIEAILWARPVAYVLMSGAEMPPGTTTLFKPFREADLVRAMNSALTIADAAAVLRALNLVHIPGAARGP